MTRIRLRRPVRRGEALTSLALAVLLGVTAGLALWATIRPASPLDLLWCRTHTEEVAWAVIVFDVDLAAEGGTAEACALAHEVGTDRLARLLEEHRSRLGLVPAEPGTTAMGEPRGSA